MRWHGGRAGVVALAGLLAGLLAAASGCVAETDVAPGSRPAEREKGSFIARTLAERTPPPTRPLPPPPRAPRFTSPFGQSITQLPSHHAEKSHGGRELLYWTLGDGPQNVVVIGGIHGDERSSSEAAYDFLQYVLAHPELLAHRRLVIAPAANPDGLAAGTRRNERNVDLNRNFPAQNWRGDDSALRHGPGDHPASEPETRFILALLASFPPTRVVATHAAAACVNWDGPAELLARRMSGECGLPAKPTIGYPTPGSLGSLLGIDRDVPTITLELASKSSLADSRDAIRRALVAALDYPDRRRASLTAPAE